MAQKRKKNKKWIWWIMMIVLFVAAGVIVYFVWDGYFRKKPNEGSNIDKPVTLDTKKGGEEQISEEEAVTVEKEKVVQYEGDDPNEQEELTGVITYAGVSGDSLAIRVNIDQYLTEGVCVLDLMRGGVSVYNDTVRLIGDVATATCEGFNVPISGLGAGGYQIVIKIESGEKTGTINGEVNI